MKIITRIMVLICMSASLFGGFAFTSAATVKTSTNAQLYKTASTSKKAEKVEKGKNLVAKSSRKGYVKLLHNKKIRYIKVSKINISGRYHATVTKNVTSLRPNLKSKAGKIKKGQNIIISGTKKNYFKTNNVYINAKCVKMDFVTPVTTTIPDYKPEDATPTPSATPSDTPDSETPPSPSPTPPSYPCADIWLWFSLDPITIYPQMSKITGTTDMWFQDSVIKVIVNGKLLTEKVIYPDNSSKFSIDVDFSECKVGDEVVVKSDYIGNRDNPHLAIWTNSRSFVIEELATPTVAPVISDYIKEATDNLYLVV